MPKKPSPRQVTLDSDLEPDVELDPRVVLVDDPRWPDAVTAMAAARWTGNDLEYASDSVDVGGDSDAGEDDPASTLLRLIQVALPDGRCLVADLGGVGDDRAARLKLYGWDGTCVTHTLDGVSVEVPNFAPGSFLFHFRDLCESRTRLKIFHHAKGDALRLRHVLGIRCRGLRCTMLASQVYYAGLPVRHGLGFLSERIAEALKLTGKKQKHPVWVVSKRLQRSEWRWHLSNAQINYAALDALVMPGIYEWLTSRIAEEGLVPATQAEFGALPAFVEMEFHGMPVNPAMLDDHIEAWRRGRELCVQPFLRRYPGVSPSRPQHVAVALSQDSCYGGHVFYELDEAKPRRTPIYICGQAFRYAFKAREKTEKYLKEDSPAVAEVVLTRWKHLPWVAALLDWRSMGVILKWLENVRRRVRRDARVRGEYAQIAGGENRSGDKDAAGKGMGRSACSAPSLQQSAHPQPLLDAMVWRAVRATTAAGERGWGRDAAPPPPFSPRLPFVPHDARAAAYLRWAVARLRGEVPDPWRDGRWLPLECVPLASGSTEGDDPCPGAAGAERGDLNTNEVASGAVDVAEGGEDAEEWPDDPAAEPQRLPGGFRADELSVEQKIAWYEELIARWEAEPEALVVADFSQAHMRIAAQSSGDPQLIEDFRANRDAHLKLAYDFGRATGQVGETVTLEEFFGWYDKRHPQYKLVKSLRQPAKTGNYTKLNRGGVDRLKQAGDTAKPPVPLPREQWAMISDAWLARYEVLRQHQRDLVDEANATDVIIDGEHYGAMWSLVTGRRLWLKKWPDDYSRRRKEHCSGCGRSHSGLTVKGNDCVAMRWLSTESDAIKWAEDKILEDLDKHDLYFVARRLVPPSEEIWGACLSLMCHDENDATCRLKYALAVAVITRKWFCRGLEWAGLVSVPAEPRTSKDQDLLVKSWADK